MVKAIVMSNIGSWDSDVIGTHSVIDVDPLNVDQSIVDVAKKMWEQHNIDITEGSSFLRTTDEINSLVEEWELSCYNDVPFTVGWISNEERFTVILLIILS